MRNTRMVGWIAGAVALSLGIVGAAWLLLAAPKFEAAALTMMQVQDAQLRNDLLSDQNRRLREDFASLEAYKDEIAAIQVGLPAHPGLTEYTRDIQELAAASGAFVLEVGPGVPQEFVPHVEPVEVVPDPAADPAAGGEAPADPAADPAGLPAVPAEPAAPLVEGLYALPVTIKAIGTFQQVTNFVQALQTGNERLFLVTSLDGVRQAEQEAGVVVPAIADGDVEMMISGLLYVMPLDGTTPVVDEPEDPDTPLPSSDRNVFAPLGGAPVAPAPPAPQD